MTDHGKKFEAEEKVDKVFGVGAQVRNLKTRRVGEVVTVKDKDSVIVRYAGDGGGEFLARNEDLEDGNMKEFDLIKGYVDAKARIAEANKALDALKTEKQKFEDALVDYLISSDKEATANYDVYGRAMISGHDVMASIGPDDKQAAFAALREIGRGEVIVEQINPKTLNSLVSELRESNIEVPKVIKYFLKPKLSVRAK